MAKQNNDEKKERAPRDKAPKEKVQSDLHEKVLYVNRTSKVVKGGRKFGFSALILVGDGKGRIGYGFAKANELTDAIRKGGEAARKDITAYALEGTTIPHELFVQHDGAKIFFKPASEGAGIIAGSHVRAVLELVGVKDVMAKSLGANNPINVVRATFKALRTFRKRSDLKTMRGLA